MSTKKGMPKRSSDPLCYSPSGTKFSKSLNTTDFAKPKKGSHSGKMSFGKKGK